MIKIEINGIEFLVKPNISVLEACKYVGITIPRFCYHETLSVAGNCRMCLVEISNSPKPVASCALPILNNMKIFVDTPLVKKARENVLETLLLNHPLDCPICDQGGECDLQDQTKVFGGDYSRFFFNKRSVEDKFCGPLIKTIMTRCIHCTRCVRFGTEIAGVEYLGTLNRGGSTEIGGYLSNSFQSEISGNVIDLCPVGALTSKPYTFKARPWELRSNESIDLTDNLGSNVYINFKESEIMRVTPKINFELNDNLISDKARFSYDSQKTQRLQRIFKKNENDKFIISTWDTALKDFEFVINEKQRITILVNEELDLSTLLAAKQLEFKHGITVKNVSQVTRSANLLVTGEANKVTDLKKNSNVCFILSSNLRIESALLNAKLRLKYTNEDFTVFGLGSTFNSTFSIQFINLSITSITRFVEGKNSLISRQLITAFNPIIFLGDNLPKYGLNILTLKSLLRKIAPTSVVIHNVLSCNSKGLELLGIKNVNRTDYIDADIIICLNLDNTYSLAQNLNASNAKVIWANTHGSTLATKSSVLLPILSEFEEERTFLNLEERPQKSFKTFSGINNMRSLKTLLKLLLNRNSAEEGGTSLNFVSENVENPSLFAAKVNKFSPLLKKRYTPINSLVTNQIIKPLFMDFHRSNKASKYSLIMSKCSQEIRKTISNFI